MMSILLIVSITLLLFGLGFLLYRWPRGTRYSFSQHAAQTRGASMFYTLLFLVTMPLLTIYVVYWFVPMFHASSLLGWLMLLVSVFQIACTLVPERGSERQIMIHRWLAGVSGGLLLPVVVCVALADVGSASRIIVLAGGVLMIGVIVWMLIQKTKTMTYRMQLVYYSGLLLPLVWIGYIGS